MIVDTLVRPSPYHIHRRCDGESTASPHLALVTRPLMNFGCERKRSSDFTDVIMDALWHMYL